MDTEAQDAARRDFRLWMKRLRKRMGMSQRDFGRKINIHHVTIGQWERGSYLPNELHRKMLNLYARDVQLEPMPQLPPNKFGPKPGSFYGKSGGDSEAGLAEAQHSPRTPQTADPA